MSERRPDVSVIIPAFDEALRVGDTLRAFAGFLAALPGSSELIVVDDGSTDPTAEVVRELAPQLPVAVRLLRYPSNRGKGYALRVGFAHARGERLLFSDADLSTPVEEATRLLEALEGADLAISSRKSTGSEIVRRQPRLREWLGRGFTLLVRLLLADVSDATCGLKAFRGSVGRDLFSRLRVDGWSFDAELLYLAERRGCRIAEIPVRWRHETGTKVDLRRDVLTSLAGIVRIRWYGARGVYESPAELRESVESWDGVESRAAAALRPTGSR
ncbi:MAG: dolichyl-phosphate beta-glucosyltransferase [Myxococcota bacterium]